MVKDFVAIVIKAYYKKSVIIEGVSKNGRTTHVFDILLKEINDHQCPINFKAVISTSKV